MTVKELFKLGAHFGFNRARQHPSTTEFVFGYKNRHAVVDLDKTLVALEKAKDFIKSIGSTGGTLLLVGSKNEARGAVETAALKLDAPYVTLRWVGGTLTNFKNIRRRIDRLAEINEGNRSGEFEKKYTKKERLVINKERENLERLFGSLSPLTKLPAAVVIIDTGEEAIALTEAAKSKVPVVALSGIDCDLRTVTYPVVANDTSTNTIKWFLEEIVTAYNAGKAAAKVETPVVEAVDNQVPPVAA